MKDFIEWLVHPNTPEWVLFLSIFVVAVIAFTTIMVSIVLLVRGYWIIPLLFWLVLPSYIVAKTYLERDR